MRYDLPDHDRHTIQAALTTAVTTSAEMEYMGRISAAGACVYVITQRWSRSGLFWLFVAAARASTFGVLSAEPGEIRVSGLTGPDGKVWREERIEPFITAVVDVDEHGRSWEPAADAFDAAIPHADRDRYLAVGEAALCFGFLFESAVTRAAGHALTMQYGPGSKWPPACDFCCAPGASVAMFPCRPFEALEHVHGPSGQRRVVEFTPEEAAQWYACATCRDDIEAGRWRGVRDRYAASRGQTRVSDEVALMWVGFKNHRTGPPVPLPDRRPGT